jgi:hypothetical protein
MKLRPSRARSGGRRRGLLHGLWGRFEGEADRLSLLKIPSEAEFERLRGISFESIRSGEAGCNPKVKAIDRAGTGPALAHRAGVRSRSA